MAIKTKEFLRKKRWESGTWQPFYVLLWGGYNVLRFITTPAYRSRVIYSIRHKNAYHQLSNFTTLNRYPDLFEAAQLHFGQHEAPKLLSFGCSTGQEVATLSQYLPHATIVGVDINDWCLAEANKNYAAPQRHFINTLSADFEDMTDFDAIFCLAVFQHPHNRHDPTRRQSAYPFAQFENQLIELNKKLKPNGLLFIDHTDFNFIETSLMPQYKILNIPHNQTVRSRPLFNRQNQKIADTQNSFRVFQKK